MPSKSEILRCQEKKSREKSGCDLLIHTLIWAACLESDKYGLPKNARFVNFCRFFVIFLCSKILCLFIKLYFQERGRKRTRLPSGIRIAV